MMTSRTEKPTLTALGLWSIPALVVLVTTAVFLPSLQNGFVNWDDEQNLLGNPNYRGLNWDQLRWMFSTFHMSNYRPLTWMTLGLDYLLWGMEPYGYHLTSLLFHAGNALLFYFITLRLLTLAWAGTSNPQDLGLRAAAGFASLAFAIHPLRVEPVAWVSARNDVVSGLFFLLTIFCYLEYAARWKYNRPRVFWLVASLFVYSLSLLSKGIGITLPIVLLILDVYPLRRLGGGPGLWLGMQVRRVWWEKVPFLGLAVAACLVALVAKGEMGALRSFEQYGVGSRIAQSLFGLAFYMGKTIVPVGLSPFYELPARLNLWEWPFLPSGIAALALGVIMFIFRRRLPAGIAAWTYYAVVLAPVLGLAQSGPQIAADRYSYLSCLGWAVLGGGALFDVWQRRLSRRISLSALICGGTLAVAVLSWFGGLTWKQVLVWHDSEALWRHAISVDRSRIAHNLLANTLLDQGRFDEAMSHYNAALRIDPAYALARKNIGLILARRGQFEKAIEYYREALRIYPPYSEAYTNIGDALTSLGRSEEAIRQYREALRIDPADFRAHNNLGLLMAKRGDLDQAIEHFRKALETSYISSRGAGFHHLLHFNLADALMRHGQLEGARGHFQQALRIQPGFIAAWEGLRRAQDFEEALRTTTASGGNPVGR